MVWCDVVWCGGVWCDVVWCGEVWWLSTLHTPPITINSHTPLPPPPQPFDKCYLGCTHDMDADTMFAGQFSAVYLFSEALPPNIVAALEYLGPGYKVPLLGRFGRFFWVILGVPGCFWGLFGGFCGILGVSSGFLVNLGGFLISF